MIAMVYNQAYYIDPINYMKVT